MRDEREIVAPLFAVVQIVEEGEADRLRQADRRAVGEREDSDVLFRNDVDGGRGAEEESAAVTDLIVAQSIFSNVPAQAVILIAGAHIGLCRILSNAADLWFVGFRECTGIDELFAVPLTFAELQANPLSEIAGAGTDSAGGRFRVGLAHEAVDGLAVDHDVQRSLVRAVFIVGEARTGGCHAEGGIELFFRDRLPGFADFGSGGDGSGGVAKVAVGICLAKDARQRQITHLVKDCRARIAEVLEQVAGFGGETTAVRKEVADGDLAGRLGVRKLEVGFEIGDAIVPTDLSLADQRSEDGGGDGLGDGGDFEDGIRVDLLGLPNLADAVAAEEDDLVVVDDGDCRSGDFGLCRLA